MKHPIVRKLIWLVSNAAFALCAWDAVHGGVGTGRVLIFITSLMFFTRFCWACIEKLKLEARKTGRSVPSWASNGFDAILILFLIWNGWWICAIALYFASVFEAAIFGAKD